MGFWNKTFGIVSFKALQKQIDANKDPISVTCRSDEKAVKVEDFMKQHGYYLRKERDKTTTSSSFNDAPLVTGQKGQPEIYSGSSVSSTSTETILVFSKNK